MAEAPPLSLTLAEHSAVAIEWSPEKIVGLSEAAASPWALAGPIDWDAIDSVRIVSATFEDGSLLALAAARPAAAAGHGDEQVGAVLRRRGDEEPELEQVLLSTEYGSNGRPTRIGIELLLSGEDVPLRAAGDAQNQAKAGERVSESGGSQPRLAASLDIRLDGSAGTGLLEILRAP